MRNVERVLELGCGNYSTRTFLNRSVFPHLKELQSIDNDAAWGEKIREAVKHDNRCRVNIVTGPMSDVVSTLDLETFDLIFADDSTTADQRAATITALSALHPQNPWTVIHDYEVDDYQRASSTFKRRFAFKAYNPETGLVSNNGVPLPEFKALDKRLKANSPRLDPDDVSAWLRVLRK